MCKGEFINQAALVVLQAPLAAVSIDLAAEMHLHVESHLLLQKLPSASVAQTPQSESGEQLANTMRRLDLSLTDLRMAAGKLT